MSNKHSKQLTIELAPFRLVDGVSEATLLAASEALQSEFLTKQSGFIKRELGRVGDGHWVDIVYWNSHEDAEKAFETASDCQACLKYFELMIGENPDDPTAGVTHAKVVKSYA